MTQVISFENYRPIARYDDVPWATVRLDEGETATGPWTQIDTFTLAPVDVDPSDPAVRNFTTSLASDTIGLWYQLTFIDGVAASEQPTVPVQNLASDSTPYATVDELARILKIRTPTDDQTVAMERVLLAAAGEINAEMDRADDDDDLAGWQLSLATEVNLERAVEHWRQQEAPFGVIGLGGELPTHLGRDSWERHALKLAPLKTQWGVA